MQNLRNYLKAHHHKPIIFNGLVWVISFVLFLLLFSKGSTPIKVDYIYTVCFILFLIPPVLIVLYGLIPIFLKKEKYVWFIIAFGITLGFFAYLHYLFFNPLLDFLFPNYFFISYLSVSWQFGIYFLFLLAIPLLKLAEDWVYFNKQEHLSLQRKNQQIQLQLATLRSQINPHFLFNSLNVIYAMAIDQKEGIKDAVVQLSEILRYIIYDTDTEQVTLQQELALLKNYIEFQKFRVHGFKATKMNVNIENENYLLYPMLLLPLVENSFKHGAKGKLEDTFVHIEMGQSGSRFNFEISNNNTATEIQNKADRSGVGLENIQKNLEIVYPTMHQFSVENKNNIFKVRLTIDTKKSLYGN